MLHRNFNKKQAVPTRDCECSFIPATPHFSEKGEQFLTRFSTQGSETTRQQNYSLESVKPTQVKIRKHSLRNREGKVENKQNVSPNDLAYYQKVSKQAVQFDANSKRILQSRRQGRSMNGAVGGRGQGLVQPIQVRLDCLKQKGVYTEQSTVASFRSHLKSSGDWWMHRKINIMYPNRQLISNSALNIDKHLEEEISFRSRAFSNYENNNIRETAYPININIKGPINSENISFEVSTARDQVHESTQTVESGNISSSRNCQKKQGDNIKKEVFNHKLSQLFFKKAQSIVDEDSQLISEIASIKSCNSNGNLKQGAWSYSLNDILRRKMHKMHLQDT